MTWRDRLFGRRPSDALALLLEGEWQCAQCGQSHTGIMDLAAFAPDQWEHAKVRQPNSELRLDADFLSEDFCVLNGEHFFVRCVLEIPIDGLPDKFGLGCWSTLSQANFDLYVERFDSGDYSELGPWFGWFSNRIATFGDTLNQRCWVFPQLDRQRPTIAFDDPEHEMTVAQTVGISPERLLELYAAYGHGPVGQHSA